MKSLSKTMLSELNIKQCLLYICCAIFVVLGLLSYGAIIYEASNLPEPWFDDAFMYIRYAENIVAGNGYCWNKDESPLYGCTDILHTYSIAGTKWLFPSLSYEAISIFLPVINYGLILLLLGFFLSRFYGNFHRRSILLLLAILSVAMLLNPFLHYHLYTGMDTILSFSANTCLIICFLLFDKKRTTKLAVLSAMAAYLTWFVRPDNLFYAILFPFFFLLFRFYKDRKLVVAYLTTFCVLMVTDLATKKLVFNEVLPLSFYVKSSGFFVGYMGERDWNPLTYLFNFIGFCWVWIALLIFFGQRKHASWFAIFFVPLLCTFAYFFDSVQMMGVAARFYFPSIPFLIFPAVMVAFSKGTNAVRSKQKAIRTVAIFLLFSGIFFWGDSASVAYSRLFLESRKPFFFPDDFVAKTIFPVYTEGSYDFYDFCAALPENTLVAAGEHGKLAALNPHLRIFDLYGLHNSFFAHHGFSADYLMNKKPSVIQLAHYNFTKINFDIVSDSVFRSEYDFYPNLFGYGVAILKEDTTIKKIFSKEVSTLYGTNSREL